MRNPKPVEVEGTVESETKPPVVEESTNGEQPDQPPLIEKSAGDSESPATAESTQPERVSALAVISAVSSSLGFLGVTSLIGLGLGIIALRQMTLNPQLTGRHLAIFGVCLSVFWLGLLIAIGSIMWVGLSLLNALFNAIFG
ncbi:MAG: DUF4190 domain-containing protein [Verrucomicrobia subdivision 3 bacterium]|nr:DUF4190 domain-containing protein [Limisphaerales bacterium]